MEATMVGAGAHRELITRNEDLGPIAMDSVEHELFGVENMDWERSTNGGTQLDMEGMDWEPTPTDHMELDSSSAEDMHGRLTDRIDMDWEQTGPGRPRDRETHNMQPFVLKADPVTFAEKTVDGNCGRWVGDSATNDIVMTDIDDLDVDMVDTNLAGVDIDVDMDGC
ncbi:hypothetical protein CCHR01_18269 [Colletotrichum chrysophilum]|uniref:Uncharacterized protein n=1 Tax=Colletotrichum chrysophilum TaxID=1836956 RepID=A0AAD9EBM7_9PEZI|nr:hypothetical protein CCHR01_18269 [Colletotrichum chrysophilum]